MADAPIESNFHLVMLGGMQQGYFMHTLLVWLPGSNWLATVNVVKDAGLDGSLIRSSRAFLMSLNNAELDCEPAERRPSIFVKHLVYLGITITTTTTMGHPMPRCWDLFPGQACIGCH